jgi:FixJ family two-component response regulator
MPVMKSVVAVVDDDVRILESLGELLEAKGFDVRSHSSGGLFMHSGDLKKIDCLITDIGMPGMDGLELKRLVGEERPDLPVILITGQRELIENYSEAPNHQSQVFLKPFDGRALLKAVSAAIVRTGSKT